MREEQRRIPEAADVNRKKQILKFGQLWQVKTNEKLGRRHDHYYYYEEECEQFPSTGDTGLRSHKEFLGRFG